MLRLKAFYVCLLLLAVAGCGGESQKPDVEDSAGQPVEETSQVSAVEAPQTAVTETVPEQPKPAKPKASPPAVAAQPAAAPQAPPVAVQEPAAAPQIQPVAVEEPVVKVEPPPIPQPEYAVIPRGTQLDVRLAEALDSSLNKTGDLFQTIMDEDLTADGKIIAPRGSLVTGKIVIAEGSGRVQGRANMSLTLVDMKIGGAVYPILCNTLSFEAEAETKKDAAKVGAGAGIGAIIGAIAGGGKGAAIGAAVGGGAGTATVLASKGKELSFGTEQKFTFTLERDVQVRLPRP